MFKKVDKNAVRKRKHLRVRKRISGTSEKPRLVVFRSNKHTYAQIIDDVNAVTLVSASSLDKEFDGKVGSNIEAARLVGKMIGERAIKKGIKTVVFDRNGYIYHGRVKSLADGAREAGLKF